MYDYETRTTTSTMSVNHYRRPEDVGFVKYLSETNVYNYFLYDRYENVYFHLHRIELVPLRKRTLQRYNDETTARV